MFAMIKELLFAILVGPVMIHIAQLPFVSHQAEVKYLNQYLQIHIRIILPGLRSQIVLICQ